MVDRSVGIDIQMADRRRCRRYVGIGVRADPFADAFGGRVDAQGARVVREQEVLAAVLQALNPTVPHVVRQRPQRSHPTRQGEGGVRELGDRQAEGR